MEDLIVAPGVTIPGSELEARTSRASGPGGQNVNKVESRVELRFMLRESAVLTGAIKARLRETARGRITKGGVLRVVSAAHREQGANLAACRDRLAALIRDALVEPARRKRTRPTRASQARRVEGKRARGAVKRGRARPPPAD